VQGGGTHINAWASKYHLVSAVACVARLRRQSQVEYTSSVWRKRFVKKVGFKLGMKDGTSDGWRD